MISNIPLEIAPKIIKPIVIPTVAPTNTPDISPVPTLVSTPATILVLTPVITPATEPSGTRGKEIIGEPAQTETPKKIFVEASKQEIEEILKIIKKNDYNVVEQLG